MTPVCRSTRKRNPEKKEDCRGPKKVRVAADKDRDANNKNGKNQTKTNKQNKKCIYNENTYINITST